MKKKIYVMITLLCLLFTIGNVSKQSSTTTVCAASKTSHNNKKAKKAFNKFLSQNKIAWPTSGNLYSKQDYFFKYMELGKKKVPVMIISCSRTYHQERYDAVLQCINGKVKLMFASDGIESVYTKSGLMVVSNLDMGAYTVRYYKLDDKGKFGSIGQTTTLYLDSKTNYYYTIGSKKYQRVNSKAG